MSNRSTQELSPVAIIRDRVLLFLPQLLHE